MRKCHISSIKSNFSVSRSCVFTSFVVTAIKLASCGSFWKNLPMQLPGDFVEICQNGAHHSAKKIERQLMIFEFLSHH